MISARPSTAEAPNTRTPNMVEYQLGSRLITQSYAPNVKSSANSIVTTFHPHREDPNDHAAVFAEYAASTDWIWVHYAQLAAALTMLAGFVVLYRAMTALRPATATDHLAVGAVIISAATVTVLQAVDGVALKHAVDGWAGKPPSDELDDWQLEPTHPDWAGGLREAWQPGEASAHRHVRPRAPPSVISAGRAPLPDGSFRCAR